jgi:pyruvate kinase
MAIVASWRGKTVIEIVNLEVMVFVRAGELQCILAALSQRQRTKAELALSEEITAALTCRSYRDSQTVVLHVPAHQAALLMALGREQGVNAAVHQEVQEALQALEAAGKMGQQDGPNEVPLVGIAPGLHR